MLVRRQNQHVTSHLEVKLAAKFGAGQLKLARPSRREMHPNRHARDEVLLKSELRNPEVVSYIFGAENQLDGPTLRKMFDAGGPAAMIGLAVGRIGDVINGEHHGTPTTAPWGVQYVNPDTLGEPGKVVHPEVAYEMVLTLGLLAVLLPFHRRLKGKLPDGVLGILYFGLYALGRFFLSFYRTDPSVFLGLRQAQIASLVMVVAAVVLIPLLLYRARRASEPRDEEPAGRA